MAKRKSVAKTAAAEESASKADVKRQKTDEPTEEAAPVADAAPAVETAEATPTPAKAPAAETTAADGSAEAAPAKRKARRSTAGATPRKSVGRRSTVSGPVEVSKDLPAHRREITWRDLDFIGAESPEAAATIKREPWRFDTMNEVLTAGDLANVNGLQIWMYPEPHQPDVAEGKVIDVPVIYAVDCLVRTNQVTKANIQGAINTLEDMTSNTFYWDPYFNSKQYSESGASPHFVLRAGRLARHSRESAKDKYQRQFYMPFIRLPQLQETYEQLIAKHRNVTANIPIDKWTIKKKLDADVAPKDASKIVAGILEAALKDNTQMAAPKDAEKLRKELRKALLSHIEERPEGEESEFVFESPYTKVVEVPYEKGMHYTSEIAEELIEDEGWISDKAQEVVKEAVHQEFEKLRASLKKQVEDAQAYFASLSPEELDALRNIRIYKFYPEHPDLDVVKLGFVNDVVNRFYGKATTVFEPRRKAAASGESTPAQAAPAAPASEQTKPGTVASFTAPTSFSAPASGGFVFSAPSSAGSAPATGGFTLPAGGFTLPTGFGTSSAPSSGGFSLPSGFGAPAPAADSAAPASTGFVFGVTDAATRAATAPPADGWKCLACEHVNKASATQCDICMCNKP